MKTFELKTTNHDSCGEPSTKLIDYGLLDDVVLNVSLFDAAMSLQDLIMIDSDDLIEASKSHYLLPTLLELQERLKASNEVLIDKGVFTNKWDLRTSWVIGEVIEIGKGNLNRSKVK